ncbi:MAG: HemK2/MTQ2 family protein methyltransferase, partial [Nanoarchaeota archaeon]
MVYEPREDSYLLESCVGKFARGRVVDIGTGSGILAFAAAKQAESVLAMDIDPLAVDVVRHEVMKKGVKNVRVLLSDLFSRVPKGEVFDCIICNPPYLPADKRVPDIALDGGPKGYEFISRFLAQAKHRLTPEGYILLLLSSFSKKRVIDKALLSDGWAFEVVASEKLDFEELFVYRIMRKDIFAKGKRGVVHLEKFKGNEIIVKEENPSSHAVGRLSIEADFLQKLNAKGIGPKFMFFKEGRLGMEFINGELILDFLGRASEKDARLVLRDVLWQCFTMDNMKVNKLEMTNPYKHMIVRKRKPKRKGISEKYESVLIDFERCRYSQKARNVTQFVQFLSGEVSRRTGRKYAVDEHKLRKYKEKPSIYNFLQILVALSLADFGERCYALLCQVPKGKVTTYREIGRALGIKGFQAVGQAMNKNPHAPEVPCHRVVASGGGLGGFASGSSNKIAILKKEGV